MNSVHSFGTFPNFRHPIHPRPKNPNCPDCNEQILQIENMYGKGSDFGMQGLISMINDIQEVFSIVGMHR